MRAFYVVMEEDSIDIRLSLTESEVIQFYWVVYGASLVDYKNTPLAKEGYMQLIEQLEAFLIRKDPDNLFKLEQVKDAIIESIKKRKDFN